MRLSHITLFSEKIYPFDLNVHLQEYTGNFEDNCTV
jgi:hypothetical protein